MILVNTIQKLKRNPLAMWIDSKKHLENSNEYSAGTKQLKILFVAENFPNSNTTFTSITGNAWNFTKFQCCCYPMHTPFVNILHIVLSPKTSATAILVGKFRNKIFIWLLVDISSYVVLTLFITFKSHRNRFRCI